MELGHLTARDLTGFIGVEQEPGYRSNFSDVLAVERDRSPLPPGFFSLSWVTYTRQLGSSNH